MGPLVLIIRDGWGYRKATDRNAIAKGKDPYTDHLMRTNPNILIEAAGEAAGVPKGYQGNSEVGHLTIGAGRIIDQPLQRINKSIRTGTFFRNPAFTHVVDHCRSKKKTLHIMGLLQTEGVHAHRDHLFALLDLCKKRRFHDVKLHVFTDGRDSPTHHAIDNMRVLARKLKQLGFGEIATISGRYYAMDRDHRWDRTEKAYDAIMHAKADATFADPIKAMKVSYDADMTDEFIVPRIKEGYAGVKAGDGMIFYNFRTDRTRQLTMAIAEKRFDGFQRKRVPVEYVAMTEFYRPMAAKVAFMPEIPKNTLGEVLAKHHKKQLRLAETEKYAHVTFFFSGQREKPFEGEDRKVIPSPRVATYDLKPEMSADAVGAYAKDAIEKGKYDVIIMNFANGDMVGHTGSWKATLAAVNAVDRNLKLVVEATLKKGGTALVFADHGNCEDMTAKWETSHTINRVPFILVSERYKNAKLRRGKGLKDIAPTALKLLGMDKPKEMTGSSIL